MLFIVKVMRTLQIMSSHHIVKDNQEPALIIANGASCSSELLQQLLEWSPFVLALDGAAVRLLEQNIRFDAWIGDFDSGAVIDESAFIKMGSMERILAPDQNKTDLHKGIEFLISKGHVAANIIWATGKRADHTFNNMALLCHYHDQITLRIIDDYSRVYPLPKSFQKWYPKGTQLSLIPIGKANGISTQNLRYPLTNDSLELPHKLGISNEVVHDGFVEILYTDGDLLMLECLD